MFTIFCAIAKHTQSISFIIEISPLIPGVHPNLVGRLSGLPAWQTEHTHSHGNQTDRMSKTTKMGYQSSVHHSPHSIRQ